jgi:single-strand DNA-binding protein
MRGVNKVILIGNATRDAELRHTQSGKAVSSIRVATNRKVGDSEESQFHTVICWDKLAEVTSQYVKKGDPLYIEGRLQYRSFQDKDGNDRQVTEIVASDVQFLSSRHAQAETDQNATGNQQPQGGNQDTDEETVSPDEIPF